MLVPDWPNSVVEPSFQKDKVLPTGFKAYTRVGTDVIVDFGSTYEQAQYNLREFVNGR